MRLSTLMGKRSGEKFQTTQKHKTMTDFSKLPVGTKVYHVISGWGKIVDSLPSDNPNRPVRFMIESGDWADTFTKEGKAWDEDENPHLYLKNPFKGTKWEVRLMEVSDNNEEWKMRDVLSYNNEGYLTKLYTPGNVCAYTLKHYRYAREIEKLTLTHAEAAEIIAKAKNVEPSQIKFVS